MAESEISQEQYDAWVKDIKGGKAVHAKGRRAVTLDELHFLMDATDAPFDAESLAPAYPQFMTLWDVGEMDRVKAENETLKSENNRLREKNTWLSDENSSLQPDAQKGRDPIKAKELAALKAENAKIASASDEMGATAAIHIAENEKLKAENADLKSALADANKKLAEMVVPAPEAPPASEPEIQPEVGAPESK